MSKRTRFHDKCVDEHSWPASNKLIRFPTGLGYRPAPQKLYTTRRWFSGKINGEVLVMKTSRLTKEQITFTQKYAELGTPVME
jgi:hypothetical protein